MGLFPMVTGWCEMASFLKSWHLSVESNTTHLQLSSGFTIRSMLDEFIEQPQSCCSPSVEDGDMQILGQEEVTQPGQRTWVNLRLSAPFSRHLYPDCPCVSKHLTSKEKKSPRICKGRPGQMKPETVTCGICHTLSTLLCLSDEAILDGRALLS